jgi:hypothetical protein
MFTFRKNGYTVAMAIQQLIVEIQWLPLTKIGFLMEEQTRHTALELAVVLVKRTLTDKHRHQEAAECNAMLAEMALAEE